MKHSTKQIFKSWSTSLKALGFSLKGSAALHEVGVVRHSITLQRSQRAAPGKIRINLYISIRDDFNEPPEFAPCLHGSVAPTRVEFADDESWWEESDLIQAGLPALQAHGLPWFDKFGGNSEVLSEWLERAIIARVPIRDLVEIPQRTHPEIESMIAPYLGSTRSMTPVDYNLFLSILRFDQGQIDSACRYAHSYLESLNRREVVFANEPERTLRQLRKMGCGNEMN